MTKLLEQAIAKVRELPEEEQDNLAQALLSMTSSEVDLSALDEGTRLAIQEGMEQARRGEFASDDEIEQIWNRHGV